MVAISIRRSDQYLANLRYRFRGAGRDIGVRKCTEGMRDYHRFKGWGTESGTLYLRLANERGGDDDRSWYATCLQFDGVVQTARRTGTSITDCRHRNVVFGNDLFEQRGGGWPREAILHVSMYGDGLVLLGKGADCFAKEFRGVPLGVVQYPETETVQRVRSRRQGTVFGGDCSSWVEDDLP